MPPHTAYGAELREIRHRLDMTQAEMSAVLGVGNGSVGRYERGKRRVPEPVIRLARALLLIRQSYRQPKP